MTNRYLQLLTLLLQDAEIANFESWVEFIIRFQRDNTKRNPALQKWFGDRRIPPMFCLRLRGKWWIGDEETWALSVEQFPLKGVPPLAPEAPLQASSLMMILGTGISALRVDGGSNPTFVLSDGRVVRVKGTNKEWEESWFLELPIDDIDRDQWSIVCDSEGRIAGKFPGSATP